MLRLRPYHQCWRDHALADDKKATGNIVFAFFLVPDYPLDRRGSATTVLGIPANAGPSSVVFSLLPEFGDLQGGFALAIPVRQLIVSQPISSVSAEFGFLWRVIEVHVVFLKEIAYAALA